MRILLVCGVGASTGFIAKSMRKAAKERKVDAEIKAASKTELMDYVEDIDILLIGPHYKLEEETLKKKVEPYGVKATIIDSDYYAMIDGDGILSQALELWESKGEK